MTNKKTINENLTEIRDLMREMGREDLAEFCEARIAQNAKKSSAERKPTARQIENETYKADILAWMEPQVLYCAGDIVKGVPSIVAANLSVSRVAPMLAQLAEGKKLVRTEDKRKAYYTLA